jgi:cysteine desulfurase
MEEGFASWANPSSPHRAGRAARAALEEARGRIAQALDWDGEIVFTSGASEAASIGFSIRRPRKLVSAVEHDAVRQAAEADAGILPVRRDGALDEEALAKALAPGPALVAVQHVNSETGNRQDISRIVDIVRGAGGLLLVDCAQSVGKFSLPPCDMAIVSAHKFGGPVGIGALLVRDLGLLPPSGGQERGYRRGTENLPAALGMAAALEACARPYLDPEVLEPLETLAKRCRAAGGVWVRDLLRDPTPTILPIAMPGLAGTAQVARLDLAGVAVSQGSACSSGAMKPSAVLEAMGLDPDIARRTIRVSFGWSTTPEEVEWFAHNWLEMAGAVGAARAGADA